VNQAQLAINSVTTTIPAGGFADALAAYAEAGFRQVEFALPQLKTWLAEGHTVAETRSILDGLGLTVLGGFETHLEVFSDPESQQENLDIQIANATLIDALGGGILIFGTDGPPAAPSVAHLPVVANRIQILLEATAGLDIRFGLEFNWGPLMKSVQTSRRICELVDSERVGIVFDPAHYHCTATKFEDLTPETVRWINQVHLNDMRDIPGDLSDCNADRVLLGEGILDMPALIGALDAGGYTGAYAMELFNAGLWELPVAEVASRCYQNLLDFCS
jgi:sugar phosphate isomerase/epimerase